MKKNKKLQLCLILGLTFGVMSGNAQYWSLTGNSGTNSTTNFLGTTDFQPLIFKADNLQKMTLRTCGAFLGIGTNDPYGTLHLHYNTESNGGFGRNCALLFASWAILGGNFPQGFNRILHITHPITGSGLNNGFSIAINGNNKDVLLRQNEEAKLRLEGLKGGLIVDTSGYIGIGTDVPRQKLHIVDGNILISRTSTRAPGSTNGSILFAADVNPQQSYANWGIEYLNSTNEGYGLNFWRCYNGGPGTYNYALFLADNGNVGVGVKNPQSKLAVDGTICAREIRASLSGSPCWPDYVFNEDYKLMSLSELEQYVATHKHLPEVPSAEDVTENGIQLGEMNAILLKKIEELTLHLIEQQKSINKLNEKIDDLEKDLKNK